MSIIPDDDDLWPICQHIKGVWIRRGGAWPVTRQAPIFIGHYDEARRAEAVAAFKGAGFRIIGPVAWPWDDETEVKRPIPSAKAAYRTEGGDAHEPQHPADKTRGVKTPRVTNRSSRDRFISAHSAQ